MGNACYRICILMYMYAFFDTERKKSFPVQHMLCRVAICAGMFEKSEKERQRSERRDHDKVLNFSPVNDGECIFRKHIADNGCLCTGLAEIMQQSISFCAQVYHVGHSSEHIKSINAIYVLRDVRQGDCDNIACPDADSGK